MKVSVNVFTDQSTPVAQKSDSLQGETKLPPTQPHRGRLVSYYVALHLQS